MRLNLWVLRLNEAKDEDVDEAGDEDGDLDGDWDGDLNRECALNPHKP